MTTDRQEGSELGVVPTEFNMLTGEKLNCKDDPTKCSTVFPETWGFKLSSSTRMMSKTVIAIMNSERFGLFRVRAQLLNTVQSIYDWGTLLSNAVVVQILFRWIAATVALHRWYRLGTCSHSRNTSIGCLANCRSFQLLPLTLPPRLKMTLFAFWTAGYEFRGSQRTLSEAWFVMYPAVTQVVLLYFSLLNLVAKVVRVRVSDAVFGPSLIVFCLHWFRESLVIFGWIEHDGRVATLVLVDEFNDKLSLLDHVGFAGDCGGRRESISDSVACEAGGRIESILAIRICNAGGLGYRHSPPRGLESYELIRLGYLVVGDRSGGGGGSSSFLISADDWDALTLLAPLRRLAHLRNHRVQVFALSDDGLANEEPPEMCHVDDQWLQRIRFWEVGALDISN